MRTVKAKNAIFIVNLLNAVRQHTVTLVHNSGHKNMDLPSEQLVLRQPLGAPKQAGHQLLSRSNLFQAVTT